MSELMEMSEYERHKYQLETKEVEARIARQDRELELTQGNRRHRLQMIEKAGPYIFTIALICAVVFTSIATYQYYQEGAVKTHNEQVECINSTPMGSTLTDAQKRRLLFDCFEIEVE